LPKEEPVLKADSLSPRKSILYSLERHSALKTAFDTLIVITLDISNTGDSTQEVGTW
jgi:hypothetical protein